MAVLVRDSESCILDRSRLGAAAIAALSTTANAGLMPQFRHGISGVEALKTAGSKFEGTGLENEHIEHIQVAFDRGKEGRNGLFVLETGDEEEPPAAAMALPPSRRYS